MSQEQSQSLMVCRCQRTMSRTMVLGWTLLLGIVVASESGEEPPKSPLLLHPSLTSKTYLNSKLLRKAKKTNFQALKEALLLQNESSKDRFSFSKTQLHIDILALLVTDDLEDDNVALETVDAPYQNLLETYPASAYPVSLYATHTYVPPIKNLYPIPQNNTKRYLYRVSQQVLDEKFM